MTKPVAPIKAWPPEPLAERLSRCAAMLRIHGVISDSERFKIHQKLLALFPVQEPKKKAKKK